MRSDRRTRFAAGIAVLSLVGSACSFSFSLGSNELDTEKAEREIATGIEEQLGIEIESVDCPDSVEIEEGDTFSCTVVATDGSEGRVEVVQEDDEGNVSWELVN